MEDFKQEAQYRKLYTELKHLTRGGFGRSFRAEVAIRKRTQDLSNFVTWLNDTELHLANGNELSKELVEAITQELSEEAPTMSVNINYC